MVSELLIRLNDRMVSRMVMLGVRVIYVVLCIYCKLVEMLVFYFGRGGCVLSFRKLRFVVCRMVLFKVSVDWMRRGLRLLMKIYKIRI